MAHNESLFSTIQELVRGKLHSGDASNIQPSDRVSREQEPLGLHELCVALAEACPENAHCQEVRNFSVALREENVPGLMADVRRLEFLAGKLRGSLSAIRPCPCQRSEDWYYPGECVEVLTRGRWMRGTVLRTDRFGADGQLHVQVEVTTANELQQFSWFKATSVRRASTEACYLQFARALLEIGGADTLVELLQPSSVDASGGRRLSVNQFLEELEGCHRPQVQFAMSFAGGLGSSTAEVATLHEFATRALWTIDCLVKRGVLESCKGPINVTRTSIDSHWWTSDTMGKAIEWIYRVRPVPKEMVRTLFTMALGEPIIPTAERAQLQQQPGPERLSFVTVGRFIESEAAVLPLVMRALCKSSITVAKQALENLHLLLLRVESNAHFFLRDPAWPTWFTPLLCGLPGGPVLDRPSSSSSSSSSSSTAAHKKKKSSTEQQQEEAV